MERIEEKPNQYYVTCIDKALSGWGHADGRTNKLIFICENEQEAEIVRDNAEDRSDMTHVNVHGTPPTDFRKTLGKNYYTGYKYVQIKTREDYPAWYQEGYFRRMKNA